MTCAECGKPPHHEELRLCTEHWRMLPKVLCKRIWNERNDKYLPARDGMNLAIAVIALSDGVLPMDEAVDSDGFCWSTGIHAAFATFDEAKEIALQPRA